MLIAGSFFPENCPYQSVSMLKIRECFKHTKLVSLILTGAKKLETVSNPFNLINQLLSKQEGFE